MRLLADENIPQPSVRMLRAAGHDVEWMSEASPGTPDAEVLAQARRTDRVLLTFDHDFGELVYRDAAPAPAAIILLRLDPADPEEPGRLLLLLSRTEIAVIGRFTVIDRERIRQRPLVASS
jgi:predicted nuclease of predicted toxin-antitoxin system